MFFGLGTLGIYLYLVSSFDSITLSEGKNYLIILPILFFVALIELYAEIKFGIRKSFKLIISGIKLVYKKVKLKILTKRIEKGKKPSDKNLKWLAKNKGEKLC